MEKILEKKQVINWNNMDVGDSFLWPKNVAFIGNQWASRQDNNRRFHGHVLRDKDQGFDPEIKQYRIVRTQ